MSKNGITDLELRESEANDDRRSDGESNLRSEIKEFLSIAGEKVISHQAFKLFDQDGDGLVTMDELRQIIAKVGGSMSEAEASALIAMADKDGKRAVDYLEFTRNVITIKSLNNQLWSAIRGDSEEEMEIREEFRNLDQDDSGFITKDEMLSVLNKCEHYTGDMVEEAKRCIDELDVDRDGRVSYPEFLLVWKYKN